MKRVNLFLFVAFVAVFLTFSLTFSVAESGDNETSSNGTNVDLCSSLDCDDGCVDGVCLDDDSDNETEVDDDNETDDSNGTKMIGLGQRIRGKVRAGVYTSESGETFRVRDLAQNRTMLSFEGEGDDEREVETELEIEEENENGTLKLKIKLKNGRRVEIKVMPERASEKALERLRLKVCSEENNCTIELKEVGRGDNNTKLAYEVQVERHSRILGIFESKMKVRVEVDAETGEVIRVRKPWWAFLAVEPEE